MKKTILLLIIIAFLALNSKIICMRFADEVSIYPTETQRMLKAANDGNLASLKSAIESGKANIHETDLGGQDVLRLSCEDKKIELMRFLLTVDFKTEAIWHTLKVAISRK